MESPSNVGAGSVQQPREFSPTRSPAIALRAGIAERLRGVCAHLPPNDFDELVAKVAEFTHRWSQAEMDARAQAQWPDREVARPIHSSE